MASLKLTFTVISVLLIPVFAVEDPTCKTTPKPDFKAEGRRISEQKCREYNWEIKNAEKCSKEPEYTKHPYTGMLGYSKEGEDKLSFLASAFLVSPKFAITGAVALVSVPKYDGPKILRLGNSDIKTPDIPRVDAKIIRKIAHPEFDRRAKRFDIGIVELEEALPITRSIQPACLWTQSLDGIEYGTAAGWGASEPNSGIADNIREMRVRILDLEQCKPLLNHYRLQLYEQQICANESVSEVQMCQGSTGAPLVTPVKLDGEDKETPYVIGVTSFGTLCGRAPNLGIYTKIPSVIDWIEEVAWK